MEIDLHGMNLEEAEAEVMRFVDQLHYRGEATGRIIHGFGVIAENLPKWLQNYPHVKSFEQVWSNPGATWVYLNEASE
ncbi:MAG: Smr/MutS family protein [Deltaproteobacteria bacterium]|nr:Smr/MutS family protein [Deltaproteobacteria bacterium]